jgi:hypothetical protein
MDESLSIDDTKCKNHWYDGVSEGRKTGLRREERGRKPNRNSPTFNKRAERDNLNRVHLDEHNLQTAEEQDHKCHLLQACGVLKTPSWRRKLSNCSLTGPEERYLAPCEAHHWSSMALSASMLTASVATPWCNRDRHTTSLYGSA